MTYERHARDCMGELVREIERDPVAAHRRLDHAHATARGQGVFLGVLAATVFYLVVFYVVLT